MEYNNATVVQFEQLPDCLFRIWIRPDWDGGAALWLPGQFLRLGVMEKPEDKKTLRAMTIIDVQDGVFEFYMVSVSGGVTSPRIGKLKVGDRCHLEPKITGNFTMKIVPDKPNADLWMMGTGTGIAPYLAMFKRDSEILHTYKKIVFVHSVRRSPHLCYQREIAEHAQDFGSFQYVPVVTREKQEGKPGLFSRIPELIHTGRLCEYAEQEFSVDHSVVMLCGHPGMIKGTIGALAELGLSKHRRRSPGNIVSERYF